MRQNTDVVRAYADELVEQLLSIYESTCPDFERGDEVEPDREWLALGAMNYAWELFDLLSGWAQNHFIGMQYASWNPVELDQYPNRDEIYPKEGCYDPRSAEMERLGESFRQRGDLIELPRFPPEGYVEALSIGVPGMRQLPEVFLRRGLMRIMRSTPSGGSCWRSAIQGAFIDADNGLENPLFKPADAAGQGNKPKADKYKHLACLYVRYLQGAGQTLTSARQIVGDAIGVSEDTLKSWERTISTKREDRAFEILAVKFAGRWFSRDVFNYKITRSPDGMVDDPDYNYRLENIYIQTAAREYAEVVTRVSETEYLGFLAESLARAKLGEV